MHLIIVRKSFKLFFFLIISKMTQFIHEHTYRIITRSLLFDIIFYYLGFIINYGV